MGHRAKDRLLWNDPHEHSFFRSLINRFFHLAARNLPGMYGLRPNLHRKRGVRMRGDVAIAADVYIDDAHPENLEIGDDVYLGVGSKIITHMRDEIGRVVIGDKVFIGVGAVILPNVTIGEGSVVTANSVVNDDVPPYTMVGGNPARPLKKITYPLGYSGDPRKFREGLLPLNKKEADLAKDEKQREAA